MNRLDASEGGITATQLAGKGADPDGANWREIWTAMETGYRETMAGLLKGTGRQGGATLQ